MDTISPPRFTTIPHLISVEEYVRRTRIKPPTAHDRIKRGDVAAVRISGRPFIDPDAPQGPGGRVARWPVGVPAPDSLVFVSRWCSEHSFRADRVFTAILMGQLPAWGISGMVVVELNDTLKTVVAGKKLLRRRKWGSGRLSI